MDAIFSIIILIMSVVVHEVSHGYMANSLGDPTARLAGRLTLNPIRHIDIFGSIIVPLMTYSLGGFILGWAKPVPYNPYNLKGGKWSEMAVAVAGPASNIFLAVFFGLLIRFGIIYQFLLPSVISIVAAIVVINLVLAIFNLIPIAPLDGSKILYGILPDSMYKFKNFMERYQLIIVLIFVFFVWQYIFPLVLWFFTLLTGVGL